MTAPSGMIPVKDAAWLMKRDPSRIYHWISEERLAHVKVTAGITYVSIAEIQELERILHRRINNRKTRSKVA